MNKLREKYLLCNAVKFVILPVVVWAMLGSFFPYMQALVPVHESDVCVCLFFKKDESLNGNRFFPLMSNMSTEANMTALTILNSSTFYSVNWLFLMCNIVAIYRIRKMKDRLDIRLEMTWVVGLWSFFDFFQYIFYFFTQQAKCPPSSPVFRWIIEYAPEFSYIVIILRDFTVHIVMVYFIIRVNKRESNIKVELAKQDSPHDLQELKTVLNSCRPLMSFSNYLDEQKPEHIVLLDYVKVYETIKDKESELDYLYNKKMKA